MATQPVLSTNTLPWPNKHIKRRGYRGGATIMADGSQVTDLVSATAKHVITLEWLAMTSTELSTVQTAIAAISAGSASYTDLDNASHTVTLDGMYEFEYESVLTANGVRFAGTLKLREA